MDLIVSCVSCGSIGRCSRSISKRVPSDGRTIAQGNCLVVEPVSCSSVSNNTSVCLSSNIASITSSDTSTSQSSEESSLCETRTVRNSACFPTISTSFSTDGRLNMDAEVATVLELINTARSVINSGLSTSSTDMRYNLNRYLTVTNFGDYTFQVTIEQ